MTPSFRPPLATRWFNWRARLAEWIGKRPFPLDGDVMLRAARRVTKLENWGDESFLEPFRLLVDAYRREARLSALGRVHAYQECMRQLTNRLGLERALARRPDILDQPIAKPLFIASLPRTGTTLLHNLLAQDPAARAPLLWELLAPAAPADGSADPRIERTQRAVAAYHRAIPKIRAIHPINPCGPEECFYLLQDAFLSPIFEMRGPIPSYMAWFLEQDLKPAYRSHRRQLQVLQYRRPNARWTLKAPAHLFGIDAILAVYPDACIVQTHRDPAVFLASTCSMYAAIQAATTDRLDLRRIGQTCLAHWREAIDRADTARQQADPARFFDLGYRDLVEDPVAAVRRLYRRFDLAWPQDMEAAVTRWLADQRRHKHGSHRYRLADFGLDRDAVHRAFADYMTRYEIQPE